MLSPLFDTISGETSFAPAWRGHPISERCSVSSSPVAAGVICLSCLLAPALPFCVRTPWYSAASVAPILIISSPFLSSCLLATPINLGAHLDGLALRRLIVPIGPVACPCGRLVLSFAPPHRHGERGERRDGLIPVLDAGARSACPFDCVG